MSEIISLLSEVLTKYGSPTFSRAEIFFVENLIRSDNEWVKFSSGLGLGVVSSALFRQNSDMDEEDATGIYEPFQDSHMGIVTPFTLGGIKPKSLQTESDMIKRNLLNKIIDTLKTKVFNSFPDVPLGKILADVRSSEGVTLSFSTSTTFHWGMFGSTLGLAHIGDALESTGDSSQLLQWQGLFNAVLQAYLNSTGSYATSQREAEEEKPGASI